MKASIVVIAFALILTGCGGEQAAAPPENALPDGAALFAMHCAACHGDAGNGTGMVPARTDFTSGAWQRSRTDDQIRTIIRNGVRGAAMPAFPMLNDEQVDALVKHLRELGD